jgi:hypothetical protein
LKVFLLIDLANVEEERGGGVNACKLTPLLLVLSILLFTREGEVTPIGDYNDITFVAVLLEPLYLPPL